MNQQLKMLDMKKTSLSIMDQKLFVHFGVITAKGVGCPSK